MISNARINKRPTRAALDFAYAGGRVYGGPYRNWMHTPDRGDVLRINMAMEIHSPAEYVVPVTDFGTPPEEEFRRALLAAARQLLQGRDVFVGCGYGIGRTGTFVAVLCKLNRELIYVLRRSHTLGDDAATDPVDEVRRVYLPIAVETVAQEDFVRTFDVRWLARRLALGVKPAVVFDKRFWML